MAGRARGPTPRPTKLKLLHGEKRPSRLNPAEPQPSSAIPELPDNASDEVREIWDATLAELRDMSLAHAADAEALRCYCEAVAVHRRASEMLAKTSILVRGQKGNLVRNPLLQIQRDAATAIRGFAAEFGLTPASRTRIEVKDPTDADEGWNPFAGNG